MRRKQFIVLCLAVFMMFTALPAHAAREGVRAFLRADLDAPVAGETVLCTFGLTAERETEAAVFRVRFQFDEQILDYKGLEPVSPVDAGELNVREEAGALTVIFVRDGAGVPVSGGAETAFFRLKFQVKKQAPLGETRLTSALDGVGTSAVEAVPVLENADRTLFVCAKSEEVCRLTSLIPSVGALSPAFSPDVTYYELPVPGNTKQVTFEAAAEQADAVIRVNRKTVEKNQAETKITVTVVSPGSGARLIYEVAVRPVLPDAPESAQGSGSEDGGGPGSETDEPYDGSIGSYGGSAAAGGVSGSSGGLWPNGGGADVFVVGGDRFSAFLQAFLLCAVLVLIFGFLFRKQLFGKASAGERRAKESKADDKQQNGEQPPEDGKR